MISALDRWFLAIVVMAMVTTRVAADGPGLGNLAYTPGELLSTVARFEAVNGAPLGHGFVSMHEGYLVVPFAADSGGGDGTGCFAFYNVSNPRSVQLTFTTQANPVHAAGGPNDPGNLGEPHGDSFTRFGGRDYVCFSQNRRAANASGLHLSSFIDITPLVSSGGRLVSLNVLTAATSEGAALPGSIRRSRTGSVTAPLDVHLMSSGTARPDRDFLQPSTTATIPPGAATLDLPISAVHDHEAEGPESVTFSLQAGSGYAAGGSSTATVLIMDRAYDDWRFSRFLPLQRIDDTVSGFEADSLRRGVPNGLAYALGLELANASLAMLARDIEDDQSMHTSIAG